MPTYAHRRHPRGRSPTASVASAWASARSVHASIASSTASRSTARVARAVEWVGESTGGCSWPAPSATCGHDRPRAAVPPAGRIISHPFARWEFDDPAVVWPDLMPIQGRYGSAWFQYVDFTYRPFAGVVNNESDADERAGMRVDSSPDGVQVRSHIAHVASPLNGISGSRPESQQTDQHGERAAAEEVQEADHGSFSPTTPNVPRESSCAVVLRRFVGGRRGRRSGPHRG
jgi:hypothetical protein